MSGTATFTGTPTFTSTNTPTASFTETVTSTFTRTATLTLTPTLTMTPTPMGTEVVLSARVEARGENGRQGALITYRIEITNNDTRPAYDLRVWDSIPAGTEYAGNNSSITPVISNGVIVWQFPKDKEIKPGEKFSIEFSVRITDATAPGNILNRASVDYHDPRYDEQAGKHPAIEAAETEYPRRPPVAYPNPFSPSTAVNGELKFANVPPYSVITLYTLSGEHVVSIDSWAIRPLWNAKNSRGAVVSPGVYYYVIRNNFSGEMVKGKIFLIK